MSDYLCRKCQFTYDEVEGDVKNGIKPGTKMKALSNSLCSMCWMKNLKQYQKNDQSYSGLEAQYYAMLCGKYDRDTFQTRVKATPLVGQTILEVGVGSGRVARCLIELGYQVDGLESSQEMIAALSRQSWTDCKAFTMIHSDFFKVRAKKKYALIYFSSTVFQELTEQENLEKVWQKATSLLSNQGEIWLELMVPEKTDWHYTRRKQLNQETTLYYDNQGKTNLFTQTIRYTTTLELFQQRFLKETYRIERDLALLFPRDLEKVLETGYRVVRVHEQEKDTSVNKGDVTSWIDGGYPLPQSSSEHRTLLIQVKKED